MAWLQAAVLPPGRDARLYGKQDACRYGVESGILPDVEGGILPRGLAAKLRKALRDFMA
jgi:hypothetical protein